MASYLSTTVISVSCYSRDEVDSIGEPSDLGQWRTNSTVPVKVVAVIKYRVAKTESDYICVIICMGVVCMSVCMCLRVCVHVCMCESHLCKYIVTCRPRTSTLREQGHNH